MGRELVVLVGGYHGFTFVKTEHCRSVGLMRPAEFCGMYENLRRELPVFGRKQFP
jgi:hypothetical protein